MNEAKVSTKRDSRSINTKITAPQLTARSLHREVVDGDPQRSFTLRVKLFCHRPTSPTMTASILAISLGLGVFLVLPLESMRIPQEKHRISKEPTCICQLLITLEFWSRNGHQRLIPEVKRQINWTGDCHPTCAEISYVYQTSCDNCDCEGRKHIMHHNRHTVSKID